MSEAIANALKNGTDEVLVPAVKDTENALKRAFHSVADGAEQVAGNVEETEAGLAKDLTRAGGKDAENVKTYFIDDEGSVQELKDGELHPVAADDSSGIRTILDSDDKVTDPSPEDMKKKYNARKDRANPTEKGVESTKIESPTDLSKAVESARKAQDDFGGKNYAALKYHDDDGNEFILVGRSGDHRSHSERSIGKPLLGGREDNVEELYTERAPCQANENCQRWLGRYFAKGNPDLKVTHGVDYDSSLTKEDRDWGHRAYLNKLEQDSADGVTTGTMGNNDFVTEGQKLQQAAQARQAARRARRHL